MKKFLAVCATAVALAFSATPAEAHQYCGWRWSNYWDQMVYRCVQYSPYYNSLYYGYPYYRPYYSPYYRPYYGPYYRPYYRPYGTYYGPNFYLHFGW